MSPSFERRLELLSCCGRPAAQLSSAGAFFARYSAVSAPVNPRRAEQDDVVLASSSLALHFCAASASASPPAPLGARTPRRHGPGYRPAPPRSAFGTLNRGAELDDMRDQRQRKTFSAPIQPGTWTTRERFLMPVGELADRELQRVRLARPAGSRSGPCRTPGARRRRAPCRCRRTSCARRRPGRRGASAPAAGVLPIASTPALDTLYDARPGMCTIAASDETSSR